MQIDWSKAPDWAEYVAQDADGSWHWYQDAPDNAFFGDQWAVDTGRYQQIRATPLTTWKDTLQRRPDPDLIEETRAAFAATPVVLPPPDSYKHTLDSTEGLPGNQPEVRRTESHVSPFGTPGVDFSSEFPVTVELLYTEKQVREILAQTAKGPTE